MVSSGFAEKRQEVISIRAGIRSSYALMIDRQLELIKVCPHERAIFTKITEREYSRAQNEYISICEFCMDCGLHDHGSPHYLPHYSGSKEVLPADFKKAVDESELLVLHVPYFPATEPVPGKGF